MNRRIIEHCAIVAATLVGDERRPRSARSLAAPLSLDRRPDAREARMADDVGERGALLLRETQRRGPSARTTSEKRETTVVGNDDDMGQLKVNKPPREHPRPCELIPLNHAALQAHARAREPVASTFKSQGRRFDSCPAHFRNPPLQSTGFGRGLSRQQRY